jgi:hypothetical protein
MSERATFVSFAEGLKYQKHCLYEFKNPEDDTKKRIRFVVARKKCPLEGKVSGVKNESEASSMGVEMHRRYSYKGSPLRPRGNRAAGIP